MDISKHEKGCKFEKLFAMEELEEHIIENIENYVSNNIIKLRQDLRK